ncbi:cytochrome P450 [Aspergillus crustosus]
MFQALSALLQLIYGIWNDPLPGIPYVSCFPILGLIFEKWSDDFYSRSMGALFHAAEKEGISWTLVGGLPLVYLRDPALIRQLFVKSNPSISRCGKETKGPFGTGKRIVPNALITAEGEVAQRWHADMLRGFHNRPSMESFHPRLISIATAHISTLLKRGSGSDLQALLQDYAMDTVWCLGLGLADASQYTRHWQQPFDQYVHMAASMSYPAQHILRNLVSGRLYSEPDHIEKNLSDQIDNCVIQLLKENSHLLNPKAVPVDEMNFLQRISFETGGSAAQPITPDVLAHAKQIFSHGYPAPTLLLLWGLTELSLHPKVKQKLRAELSESTWHDDQTLQKLQTLLKLPYLDAVVNELLRIHPPIPTTARAIDYPLHMETQSGLQFELPVTARVAVSLDMLHHDVQIWGEDASVFRPERWHNLRSNIMESECKYLPFLTGPRRCPCTGFVVQQIKVFLAALLCKGDLEVVNAAAVEKKLGPVAGPTAPVAFTVMPATSIQTPFVL